MLQMEGAEGSGDQPSPSLRRSTSAMPPPPSSGEADELRKKLADLEKRKAREVQALNQEVGLLACPVNTTHEAFIGLGARGVG